MLFGFHGLLTPFLLFVLLQSANARARLFFFVRSFFRHALFDMFAVILLLLFRCLFSFIALIVFRSSATEEKKEKERERSTPMAREFWKPNTKLGHSTLWRYTILCLAVALIYPHTCHWEHCACCWCWCYAMLCVHGMLSIPLPSPSLSSSSSLLYHSCRLDCGLYRIEYTALSLSFSVGVLLLAAGCWLLLMMHTQVLSRC